MNSLLESMEYFEPKSWAGVRKDMTLLIIMSDLAPSITARLQLLGES